VAAGDEGSPLRAFVALELPDAVQRALGAWAAHALGALDAVRLVAPESLHVTLCFMGTIDAAWVDGVGAAVGAACLGRGPLALSVGEAVALPARRPRVVAARIGGPGERELAALQAALAARLAAGGWYRPEVRPFLAHVTLARVRSRAQARLDGRVVADLVPAAAAPFTADTVTLFRSHTGPGGARYEPLVRVPLAG
jgi:RNA 2',3'-cyclic 3'-phosphodiesterase